MKKRINAGGLEFLAMGAGGMTPSGPIGQRLLNAGMDTGIFKPYIGDDGFAYMTRFVNGKAGDSYQRQCHSSEGRVETAGRCGSVRCPGASGWCS